MGDWGGKATTRAGERVRGGLAHAARPHRAPRASKRGMALACGTRPSARECAGEMRSDAATRGAESDLWTRGGRVAAASPLPRAARRREERDNLSADLVLSRGIRATPEHGATLAILAAREELERSQQLRHPSLEQRFEPLPLVAVRALLELT